MKQVTSLFLCMLFVAMSSPSQAQDENKRDRKKKNDAEEVAPAVEPEEKGEKQFKEIAEVTKACHKNEGLFSIYQDTTNGKTYLEISEDQIGTEVIYFKHVLEGLMAARYFRGAYRDNKIFKIERYYDKIELREQNTRYYFNPESALSKASEANINEPIVFSAKIAGMSMGEDSVIRYIIESDAMFLTESISQTKPSSSPGSSKSFNLGKLSKTKTKYNSIKNYPENTDVIVEYGFENPYPTVSGGDDVTNSRYVTLTVQHSLIAMPNNDYRPRYEDPRIGYFIDKSTDLTTPSATPYRDMINRWHLEKKDPDAALSEPVAPIVYWIENTTPHEIRGIIKEAGEKWNEAFEVAGFKNAFMIKEQPDDAEWDAGDIRYNVLRWTSSPTPPFGGYGPSFSNPRTGQTLGADIMFEYVKLVNLLKFKKYLGLDGIMMDEEIAFSEEQWEEDAFHCNVALHAQHEAFFTNYAGGALGLDDAEKEEIVRQSLSRVVLHEIGHTLGLAHNFCASQSIELGDLNNTEITDKIGLSASVMDYQTANIALDRNEQGGYYIEQPGIYDEWAIEYGYSEFKDEVTEAEGLKAILAKSSNPDLCFGNDAEDMRSAGKGMDPRINVGDMSADAVGFSINRIELIKKTIPNLKDHLLEDGGTYHQLRDGYNSLTGNYGSSLTIISRYIGGVYTDRSRVGDETDVKPLTPVPYDEQKRAMKAISEYGFAPDAFEFDRELLNYLKRQRRGWDSRGVGGDPLEHSRVLTMQKNVLNHIMHPTTLTRLTDSQLYGNEYSVSEMLGDLTSAIFDADLYKEVNTFRQHIQLEYVNRLGSILSSSKGNNYSTRSAALYQLEKIKSKVTRAKSSNESTKAHRNHVLYSIDNILDTDN